MSTVGIAFYAEEDRASIHQVSAWDSVAAAWGYALHVIDPSGELVVRKYARACRSLADLTAQHPDATFVYLLQKKSVPEGWPATPLPDYKHPMDSDVIYVFGGNRTGIKTAEMSTQNGSHIVNIEIGGPEADRGLWSFDAAIVLVYDRFLKARLDT